MKKDLVELVRLKRKAVKEKANPEIVKRIQSQITKATTELLGSKDTDTFNNSEPMGKVIEFKKEMK